ncbi:unnamed protein product, partial [Staurois parvus]
MTRDCGHGGGAAPLKNAALGKYLVFLVVNRPLDILQEMNRDCRHSTGDEQTADIVHEMTRDCGHSTGDDQRLR